MQRSFKAVALALLLPFCAGAASAAEVCTKDEFAAVVDEAGDVLRTLNDGNTPRFQADLRTLKTKRAWDDATFLERAREFVEDQKIIAYDEIAGQFLANINQLGDEGDGHEPDCKLLIELRGHLFGLVVTMKAKWAYMFGKLELALQQE